MFTVSYRREEKKFQIRVLNLKFTFVVVVFRQINMLWVLKRNLSMRQSFEHPNQIFELMDKKVIKI